MGLQDRTFRLLAVGVVLAVVIAGVLYLAMARGRPETAEAPATTTPEQLAASGQPGIDCQGVPVPVLSPTISSTFTGQKHDAAFDCFMWQTFIYLNWPALAGSPGQPDPSSQFGAASRPVVWQTYKPYEEIFVPDVATPPAGWGTPVVDGRAPDGSVRVLDQSSKFSEEFQSESDDMLEPHLVEDKQVDNHILVDLAGNNVYYEELVNEVQFNYIVDNGLYNATCQYQLYSSGGFIKLPDGAIEVKAAWKILNEQDNAERFFTTQALISGMQAPVTVGLVGLHVLQFVPGLDQGIWATFQQMDNAPPEPTKLPETPVPQSTYSFYQPNCDNCATPNAVVTPPAPAQIQRVAPIPAAALAVNNYVHQLMQGSDSPWNYYELINVQWPKTPVTLTHNIASTPHLPNGTPNANGPQTPVTNPALESYKTINSLDCLLCHRLATTPNTPTPSVPDGWSGPKASSSYSFLFQHAEFGPPELCPAPAASTPTTSP